MDGLSAELRAAFSGSEIEFDLVESGGGVFEVDVDGQRVFSKQKQGRFPEYQEVPRLVLEMD